MTGRVATWSGYRMWPLPGLLRRCGHVPRPVRTSPQKQKPSELQLFQNKRRQRIVRRWVLMLIFIGPTIEPPT
jgi:hypothetical protein